MKIKNKVDLIIQARIGSTRFRGKIFKKYKNYFPLKILIERLKNVQMFQILLFVQQD